MASKIGLLTLGVIMVSCIAQKPIKIEITSPNFNPYFGHQHLTLANDTFFVDTSFYPDLSLAPFVEKLYFKKNTIITSDLIFNTTSNSSLTWLKELTISDIKKLSRQSRKTKLICNEYRFIVETFNRTKSIIIYQPLDSCENNNICNVTQLFKEKDSLSFQCFYK